MKKITMFLLALLSFCWGAKAEEVTLTDTPVTNIGAEGKWFYILSDGGTELKNAGAQVGQEVRFYVTFETEGTLLEVWGGHWAGTFLENLNPADFTKGYIPLKLTQEILDVVYEQQNWGGSFVINTDWEMTVTKVTLADTETTSGLSLKGWNPWDDGIILTENTDGSLTIDFNTVSAWSGTSKWLGGFDASDYDYLVFEIEPLTSGSSYTVQTWLKYAEGEAETMQWTLDESKRYLRLPLDAARKNAIEQVAFQNPTDEGVPFTVKEAYWMSKIDFAELNSTWYDRKNIEVDDRAMFLSYDNFDYMVFEFSPQTTTALNLIPKYGFNINGSPWWVQDSDADKVTTDAFLLTAFVPMPENTVKELYYMGYELKAAVAGDRVAQPSKVYVATKEYLLEQGFTEEQLANHIYAPAGRLDLDISHSVIPDEDGTTYPEGYWGWNNFQYDASDQFIQAGNYNGSGGVMWSIWKDPSGSYLQEHSGDYGYVVAEFDGYNSSYPYYMRMHGASSNVETDTWIDPYCTKAVWKYNDVEDLRYIGFTLAESARVKITGLYLATEEYLTENGLMNVGKLVNQYERPEYAYYLSTLGQPVAPNSEYVKTKYQWNPQEATSTLDWQFTYDETNEFEPDEYDYLVFRFAKGTPTRTAQIKVSSGSYSITTDIASPDESMTCRQKVVKIDDEGLMEQFFEGEKWIEHISLINPTPGESFTLANVYLVNSRKSGSVPEDIYEPNADLTDFVEIPLTSWIAGYGIESSVVTDNPSPVLNVTAAPKVVTLDGEEQEDDFEVDPGYAPTLFYAATPGSGTSDEAYKITMGYNNLDYLVVEFAQPTSSPVGFMMTVVTDWTSADTQVTVQPKDAMAQPFCKTVFIPLPKNEDNMTNDLVYFMALPMFKTHSVTHIARTYLASTDYLLENGFTEDVIASGIYGEGESVTIGSTGYATLYFPGMNDYYVPGGLKGYDYEYEYELNSGVPPVLNVAHEYVADEKVNGEYAAVLKAEETVKLPYTFYFPKAETELEGAYTRGTYSCLFGTEEEGETVNMIQPSQVRYYKLSTKNGKHVGFYWGAPDGGPFTNGAKKAYLVLPNYEEYEAANGYVFDTDMNLVPDGSTTGITSVSADNNADAPTYNLSGQRVGASYRGIVIQNGKKTTRK